MKTTSIPNTFGAALLYIAAAQGPEDLFGKLPNDSDGKKTSHETIIRMFRKLAHLVHPDKNPNDKERAALAFGRLEELRNQAESMFNATQTKTAPASFAPVSFKTKKYTCTITSRIAVGGMCDVFDGVMIDTQGAKVQILVKVPRSATDNDLMKREARAYSSFKKKAKEIATDADGEKLAKAFLWHFPTCLDSIEIEEPNSLQKKTVTILARHPDFIEGWYNLEAIRNAYPQGISTRVMAFIWNRILEGLMFAHKVGILHGALTPNHVIIHTQSHMGNIIDWSASCKIGETEVIPYIDDKYKAFYPEEVLDPKGMATPETDIYMSAWCMVYLLGGDPVNQEIPATIEAPIVELLNACLQPRRRLRPHSADDVYRKFKEINKKLWGPRKFIELKMP